MNGLSDNSVVLQLLHTDFWSWFHQQMRSWNKKLPRISQTF